MPSFAWPDLWAGTQKKVVLPFEISGGTGTLLGPGLLVKQGVESAEDSGAPVGTRRLGRFDFVIYESERMGELDPGDKGYDLERRYGFPRDAGQRRDYVDNWAFEPVDPNMPHLLMVTFYEAKVDDDLVDFYDDEGSHVFSLPKRRLQRVVCRMFVHPSGNWPGESAIKSLAGDLVEKMTDVLDKITSTISGWLMSLVHGVAKTPVGVATKSTELVCAGVGKLDELGSEAEDIPTTLVDEEGRLRVNSALKSRRDGEALCHKTSSPPATTCERTSDAIFEGSCHRLPEMRLSVEDAEFINPASDLTYDEFFPSFRDSTLWGYGQRGGLDLKAVGGASGVDPKFSRVDAPIDPSNINSRNVGLTRAFLKWEFLWDDASPDIHDVIDGFMVFVYPDQKAARVEMPEGGFAFALPKAVQTEDSSTGDFRVYRVNGFSMGGLDYYPATSTRAVDTSDSVVSATGGTQFDEREPVGGSIAKAHYNGFNGLTQSMPLAPGFVHGFEVAPYTGVPGRFDFKLGPRSERVELDGNLVVCEEVADPAMDANPPVPADVADAQDIYQLYDCGPPASAAALGYANDGFRAGLLELTGSDICWGIFTGTPADFTWNNRTVRQVWGLVWIIAGGVLFTLLVWQGLRMTYDVWLATQPAVGLRQLLPRFLLAVVLAAGSLIICRMVLVLASSLTCFVAEYTGMSMWGVIGATFGTLMDGFLSWATGRAAREGSLLAALGNAFMLAFFGTIVVLVLLFMFYLFVKVILGMVLRIAMLAILIALSPLAFAFYASDATAHWTKKWVSMFLGSTFQQVVVLLVLYLGISIMREYLTAGLESGVTDMLVGMILAFVTLSLAASVPDIVNPAGKGVFSSLSQMGMMALAGAAIVTGGVAGAVGGGLGPAADGSDERVRRRGGTPATGASSLPAAGLRAAEPRQPVVGSAEPEFHGVRLCGPPSAASRPPVGLGPGRRDGP